MAASRKEKRHLMFCVACCILATVLCMGFFANRAAALYEASEEGKPLYRASVTIYVHNAINTADNDYIAGSDLSVSQNLVNTYVNIIKSDTVLRKVAEDVEFVYSAAQIRDMISAEQVDGTEIFDLYVVNEDPQMAADIANAIANVAPDVFENLVEGSSTKIIDYAKVPIAPYVEESLLEETAQESEIAGNRQTEENSTLLIGMGIGLVVGSIIGMLGTWLIIMIVKRKKQERKSYERRSQ